jgi:hypothetical protein
MHYDRESDSCFPQTVQSTRFSQHNTRASGNDEHSIVGTIGAIVSMNKINHLNKEFAPNGSAQLLRETSSRSS